MALRQQRLRAREIRGDAGGPAACKPIRSGLEVGCSIGVLTSQLARRCDRLLAVDLRRGGAEPSARAVCRRCPGVEFALMELPRQLPDGPFDLLVLSEVVYYWSAARSRAHGRVRQAGRGAGRRHRPGPLDRGHRLSAQRRRGGAALHRRHARLHAARAPDRAEHYRIDVLRRIGRPRPRRRSVRSSLRGERSASGSCRGVSGRKARTGLARSSAAQVGAEMLRPSGPSASAVIEAELARPKLRRAAGALPMATPQGGPQPAASATGCSAGSSAGSQARSGARIRCLIVAAMPASARPSSRHDTSDLGREAMAHPAARQALRSRQCAILAGGDRRQAADPAIGLEGDGEAGSGGDAMARPRIVPLGVEPGRAARPAAIHSGSPAARAGSALGGKQRMLGRIGADEAGDQIGTVGDRGEIGRRASAGRRGHRHRW